MIQLLLILLLSTGAFADELVTDDITEKDAGATHKCLRTNGSCTYDPRTDIWSDGGSDDDVIYWDQHGNLNDGHRDTSFSIMNDIDTFLTEAEMLAGFTLDSSIVSEGGDPASSGESILLETGGDDYLISEEYIIGDGVIDKTAQNELFDELDDTLLDFNESNPFGDVGSPS